MSTHRISVFSMPMVFALLAFIGFIGIADSLNAQEVDVWIGTGGNDGIFHLKLDTSSGKLSDPTCAARVAGTGFLAMHPNKAVLYSTAKQLDEGGIAAFAIGNEALHGELAELQKQSALTREMLGPKHQNTKRLVEQIENLEKSIKATTNTELTMLKFVSSGDGHAACVGVDKTGKTAFSAQYGGGSMSSYTLKPNGKIGKLTGVIEHGPGSGVVEKRQRSSHPHWVGTSPDNRFVFVPDLGKDTVVVYELNTKTGKPTKHAEVVLPPGSGPRHMKFHTSGKYAYVLNELTMTVSVFEYVAANANFKNIQLIETLPEDLKDKHLNSAAEIRVHPSGKYVYTSNRGHDSITVFSIDESTGQLTFVEREHIRGATPRNFNIDPSGKWLLAAGQRSNTLAVFEIDPESGKLVYARQCVNIPNPICVLFTHE